MTLLTDVIVRRLQSAGSINFRNWSPGELPRGLTFRMTRIWKILRSVGAILSHGGVRNGRLYLAANTKAGLWFTALIVFVGRQLGYEIYLHHHTYTYLDRFDRRMAWISRMMGNEGVHVVHCRKMERDFCRLYPASHRFVHLYPSIVSVPVGTPRAIPKDPFCIGHLGNLCHAKGLDLVLSTFDMLHQQGRHVRLKLAGPCHTGKARRMIESALLAYPVHVEWIGPAFGQVKLDFFKEIDCFLFPTRNESWGIVLNEAMASGVPVIASKRGCIGTVVGEHAGVIVNRDDDYLSRAARQIEYWIDRPDEYQAASEGACQQATYLHRVADQMLDNFVKQLFDPPVSTKTTRHNSPM